MTLPTLSVVLETKNKYTLSCLTDKLRASVYVMLVERAYLGIVVLTAI